ncbi:MAG: dephospho-CoA kinase [Bacteroidia bacterium]|nr:dephospho-CoA kinase [Bacteroidia bacterium]
MNLWKIGITGGIGSGKSRVCMIFASLGYRIYSADDRARWLMTHDEELKESIRNLFGEDAYLPDGSLNRDKIGKTVFSNGDMLSRLNAAVHPVTARDFEDWVTQTPAGYSKSFVIKEAAILFESGAYKTADAVVSVYAPKNIRIQRVVERDHTTPKAVQDRMNKQWSEVEKILRSDFVIYNDSLHPLTVQVTEAIRFLEKKMLTGIPLPDSL